MVLLAKFYRLPLEEKRLIIQAIYLITCFRTKLKFLSARVVFTQVREEKTTGRRTINRTSVSSQRIASILKYLQVCTSSTCLPLALAGYVLMTQNGHKADLHIGVAKDDMARLEAHAWLTFDGDMILGKIEDIARFKELPDIWSIIK